MSTRHVLGVSCDYHDSAAALLADGEVVAAAEEERFTRVKHDTSLPVNALAACLAVGGIGPDDLEAVVVYEKPLDVMARVLAARQSRGLGGVAPFVADFPVLLRRNALVAHRIERALRALGGTTRPTIRYAEHHLSHAGAAFLPSPFPTAAIITIDGVGEWSTASIAHGIRHRIEPLVEQRYPHSLGLLYSLATAWCGFRPNDGEYKLMGLAPFGRPRFREALAELVEVHEDGSITVDSRAVRFWSASPRRLGRVADALGGLPRADGEPLDQRHADIARSVQDLVEDAVLAMAAHARALTGESSVCLSGGVALNCVANGRLRREGPFSDVWVPPAPGDAGSAVGAALWYWHGELGRPRDRGDRRRRTVDPPDGEGGGDEAAVDDAMSGAQLGPRVTTEEVVAWARSEGIPHTVEPDEGALCATVAARLAEGALVGWFQGRMELGPRALGQRSILADPRSPTVHRDLNERVKGRESFRPFAPSVLWERAAEWFDVDGPSPFMSFVVPVAEAQRVPVRAEPDGFAARAQLPRSTIPACTHVDGTARAQTVHEELSPRFHRLIDAFGARTGCPVLVNTSFNLAGEPIVATPEQALATARRGGLDLLVVEDVLIDLAPEWV